MREAADRRRQQLVDERLCLSHQQRNLFILFFLFYFQIPACLYLHASP